MTGEVLESSSQENDSIDNVDKVILKTFHFLMAHNGAGKMEINVKLLKRGQKEILIQCGRTYRFVVDANTEGKEA